MLKSNCFKTLGLLLFAMLLTNPNHDEFVYQVSRYSFQYIKQDPELQYEYEISSDNRKRAFEDKYATAIAYEFRKSEARDKLRIYNLLLFTVAMFADSSRDFYFVSVLKFSISNFEKSFTDYKKEN